MTKQEFWVPDEIVELCGYVRTGNESECDKCYAVIKKEDCKTRADMKRLERESDTENKTCPFCGSDSIEVYTHYGESVGIKYGGYYPECTVCGCRLDYYDSREEALNAWNRRADDGNDSKRADM